MKNTRYVYSFLQMFFKSKNRQLVKLKIKNPAQ